LFCFFWTKILPRSTTSSVTGSGAPRSPERLGLSLGPAGCAWILRKSSERVTIPLRALREVLSMPSIEGTLASRAADVARRRFFRDEVGTRK